MTVSSWARGSTGSLLGAIAAGQNTSATIALSNVGTLPLTATIAVTVGGPTFLVNSTGAYLAAGGGTEVTVTFAPSAVGAYTGALTFTSDDPDEATVVVALSGSAELDSDGDTYVDSEDCDPADPEINPSATEVYYDGIDTNCDGLSDYDADADGYDSTDYAGNDCNDADAAINPAAAEIWYDGVDQDCDNRSDYDQDGDGFDSADYSGEDCDDLNAAASPGTLEIEGNGFDDDCDGNVDEARSTEDLDQDGYSEVDGDCNDNDAAVNPGAAEIWYDGFDQNCDGASDYDQDADSYDDRAYGGGDCWDTGATLNPATTETYYDGIDANCDGWSDYDADMDGYDDVSGGGDDCDDADGTINPSQTDVWYDGIDSDCDGASDFDQDADGEDDLGYGGTDCNDLDASVGTFTVEVCDGLDQNCDGVADDGATTAYYTDSDGDFYGDTATMVEACSQPAGTIAVGGDCNDADPTINPIARESCDYIDQDCDGTIDEGSQSRFYLDADVDGYGLSSQRKLDCTAPSGYVADATDCDDGNAAINPGMAEECNDIDDDCDGVVDDGISGSAVYYADADSDGYGDPATGVETCTPDAGTVLDGTDCDDANAAINPGETEAGYDAADNDCDGIQDDMVASDWSDWTVTGENSGDYLGSGALLVSEDLNGDGETELIIGSPVYNYSTWWGGYTDAGMLGFHDSDTAGNPADAEDGWYRLYGYGSDNMGASITSGNSDGGSYTEVAVGAPYDSSEGDYAGSVYVFDLYNESGDDFNYEPTEGAINGTSDDGHLGSAVAFGDMDGDGDLDLATGAPGESSNRGRTYVALSADGYYSSSIDADDASYYVRGVSTSDMLGTSVAFGDFNNDGYDDIVSCAPGDDDGGTDAGTCWVDAGSAAPSENDTTVSSAYTAVITGPAAYANLGGTGAGLAVGDFDNDGVDDLAVGVSGYSSVATYAGAAAIWKGGSLSGSETTATADWLVRGGTTSGYLGYSVAFADISGDGIVDLLTGATGDGAAAEGVLYLFEGAQAAGTYDLPSDQFASWSGPSAGGAMGYRVSGGTDLDGDGTPDFAVSSPADDEDASSGGQVFVLSGY